MTKKEIEQFDDEIDLREIIEETDSILRNYLTKNLNDTSDYKVSKNMKEKFNLKVLLGAIVGSIFGLFVILIQNALKAKEA